MQLGDYCHKYLNEGERERLRKGTGATSEGAATTESVKKLFLVMMMNPIMKSNKIQLQREREETTNLVNRIFLNLIKYRISLVTVTNSVSLISPAPLKIVYYYVTYPHVVKPGSKILIKKIFTPTTYIS